ncbi:MAG: family 20 glycosylhydrolase [Bacteroidales bacterium]|nr:family 20 glycosylhydrolase [Bacteroidales bacterium]
MDRRNFISSAAAGLVAAGMGISCAPGARKPRIPKTHPQTAQAGIGDIRSVLLHLGNNMWCDYPSAQMGEDMEQAIKSLKKKPDLHLICSDELWRRATDRAAERGINMIVIDLGEGLFYPSHPELAIEGTWSIEKMRTEIDRLNSLGIEVIPKLNFSTTHNGWMGDYTHMVSSKPYYRMCEEVISDVMEIFGHPRFFHIGCDEETADFQQKQGYKYICIRQDDYWWKDLYHLVDTIEGHGARPWMWSDHFWYHEDFVKRCPKSVIQQNWFYDSAYGGFDLEKNFTSDRIRLESFLKLDEAGFDQVPCSTNWVGGKRRAEGLGADDVIGGLVPFCREHISKDHLLGFMMAPWDPTDNEKHIQHTISGIDLFADALAG